MIFFLFMRNEEIKENFKRGGKHNEKNNTTNRTIIKSNITIITKTCIQKQHHM